MAMIGNQKISLAQSNLKLALWNAEAESTTSNQFYTKLRDLGLQEEIVSRLHELIYFTKKITGKVFAIGKIVLLKIIEFVKTHPFLVISVGISAVISSIITGLIISIPFLGTVLAPLAAGLGVAITTIGMVSGYKLDKYFEGVGEDIAEIIQVFFSLFSDVFNIIIGNTIFI
jgi:uncharacterized membrane protein